MAVGLLPRPSPYVALIQVYGESADFSRLLQDGGVSTLSSMDVTSLLRAREIVSNWI